MHRLVEANHNKFDCSEPFPGAAEQQTRALEAALTAALANAAEVQAMLDATRHSTSWRVTYPLRWMMEAVQRVRAIAPPAHDNVPSSLPPEPLSYDEWIRTEEPGRLAALQQSGPGHQAIVPQRLGLVLLDGFGLQDLLAQCPAEYAVLVLDQEAAPFAPAEENGRVLRKSVQPGFAAAEAVSLALDLLDADMLCFLDRGNQLAPGALALAASVLAQQPHIDLLFADEDWLDAKGRRTQPFFKPGWDPELQRGRDLVGPFAFFHRSLLGSITALSSPAWHYDLANQAIAATEPGRIHHIPAVLCHRIAVAPGHSEAMQRATTAQLQRDGIAARVEPLRPGHQRLIYDLPHPEPLVSIIVPTRDHADLLRVCADGILNHTAYPRLELLIVDNGTTDPDASAMLDTLAADCRVRVLRQAGAFNWSALNNVAAAQAAGSVLILLNNDIAVLQPDWLAVLVSHALQPDIGAVGAKLLYPDGRVQHAGLTTDATGIPRHLLRYAPGDETDGLLGLARGVWGLTGACLAIRRDVFFEVGGLNEALPVAYNDMDLCLRLTAHGYRLIWTPWALVEHREMASRPPDHSASRRDQVREERDRLLRDWGSLVLHDPFHNPNLHLLDEQPCLRRTPKPLFVL